MELRQRYNDNHLSEFAEKLMKMDNKINFKVSSRGWAYLMEQQRMVNKDQFDKIASLINTCRKKGFLPIDFVSEEASRTFKNVIDPYEGTVVDRFSDYIEHATNIDKYMELDWWRGEKYYIQMVVEKVDLVALFLPICRKYKIPIANSRGWSSMLQRAGYTRRFKKAQDKGLKCVLLYCGDHDPDGLRIGDFIRKNLMELKDVTWSDGETGYDPTDLIVDRFGLNYDFIEKNKFTWIDNLITGGKKNLASPKHKNYHMDYVQNYLRDVGERKCEANALVTAPKIAGDFCEKAILKYLGNDVLKRFSNQRVLVRKEFKKFKEKENINEKINNLIDIANNYEL